MLLPSSTDFQANCSIIIIFMCVFFQPLESLFNVGELHVSGDGLRFVDDSTEVSSDRSMQSVV